MRARLITTLSAGLLLCSLPRVAAGYCLNIPQGLSKPVSWKTIPVTYRVSDNLTDAAMLKAIDDAFATWEAVQCSTLKFTKGSQFKICTETDKSKCAANTVHWDSFGTGYIYIFWFDGSNKAAFPTGDTNAYYNFVNYDLPDAIKGGAVAVNAFKYKWDAKGGDTSTLDVQNEVTTMVGSLIGLDFSTVATSSMYDKMKFGDTSKQTLDQDDIDGLTYLYLDSSNASCTAPPGPSTGCGGTQPAGDGTTPAGDGTTPAGDGTTPAGDGSPPAGDGSPPIYTEGGVTTGDGGTGKQCNSNADCAADEVCTMEGICVKVGDGGGDDDGCGCRIAARAGLPLPALALLLALGLVLLRRRR